MRNKGAIKKQQSSLAGNIDSINQQLPTKPDQFAQNQAINDAEDR
jgi:hypothetical protein